MTLSIGNVDAKLLDSVNAAVYLRRMALLKKTDQPRNQLRGRVRERVVWLLRHLASRSSGFDVAWSEETVDAFVKAFPESENTLRIYMMGPNSSPTLNRTAGIAAKIGYLDAGHIGNEDARSYNQRTWCRTWTLTELGRRFIKENDDAAP